MIDWMTVLTMASGPVIGAIIGYFTNYIAVKMLFRPLNPVKIGIWTLPFTPGIFPKRKKQLAKALGNVVGNNLLTRSDVIELFMSNSTMNAVVGGICQTLYADDNQHTINKMFADNFQEEQEQSGEDNNVYQQVKDQLVNIICEKIRSGLIRMDVGRIIAGEVGQGIREKTQGTMLALMVNDKLIASLTTPIGERIEKYVNENSNSMIRPFVDEELQTLGNQPIGNIIRQTGISEELLKEMIGKVYAGFIQNKVGELVQQFDIAGVVEDKVNAMDVLEIEQLVLSVMKNELKAIVNLGALIGFIIGMANLFIK